MEGHPHPHSRSLPTVEDNKWIADRLYAHITKHQEYFSEIQDLPQPEPMCIGNGKYVYATKKGRMPIEIYNGKEWRDSFLKM
jgi:hypothetical protein